MYILFLNLHFLREHKYFTLQRSVDILENKLEHTNYKFEKLVKIILDFTQTRNLESLDSVKQLIQMPSISKAAKSDSFIEPSVSISNRMKKVHKSVNDYKVYLTKSDDESSPYKLGSFRYKKPNVSLTQPKKNKFIPNVNIKGKPSYTNIVTPVNSKYRTAKTCRSENLRVAKNTPSKVFEKLNKSKSSSNNIIHASNVDGQVDTIAYDIHNKPRYESNLNNSPKI